MTIIHSNAPTSTNASGQSTSSLVAKGEDARDAAEFESFVQGEESKDNAAKENDRMDRIRQKRLLKKLVRQERANRQENRQSKMSADRFNPDANAVEEREAGSDDLDAFDDLVEEFMNEFSDDTSHEEVQSEEWVFNDSQQEVVAEEVTIEEGVEEEVDTEEVEEDTMQEEITEDLQQQVGGDEALQRDDEAQDADIEYERYKYLSDRDSNTDRNEQRSGREGGQEGDGRRTQQDRVDTVKQQMAVHYGSGFSEFHKKTALSDLYIADEQQVKAIVRNPSERGGQQGEEQGDGGNSGSEQLDGSQQQAHDEAVMVSLGEELEVDEVVEEEEEFESDEEDHSSQSLTDDRKSVSESASGRDTGQNRQNNSQHFGAVDDADVTDMEIDLEDELSQWGDELDTMIDDDQEGGSGKPIEGTQGDGQQGGDGSGSGGNYDEMLLALGGEPNEASSTQDRNLGDIQLASLKAMTGIYKEDVLLKKLDNYYAKLVRETVAKLYVTTPNASFGSGLMLTLKDSIFPDTHIKLTMQAGHLEVMVMAPPALYFKMLQEQERLRKMLERRMRGEPFTIKLAQSTSSPSHTTQAQSRSNPLQFPYNDPFEI